MVQRPRIDSMGHLFVEEGLVDPYVVCVDSTILKARRGLEWHTKDMRGGPRPVHWDRHGGEVGQEQDEGMGIRVQAPPVVQHGLPHGPSVRCLHHGERPDNQMYSRVTSSLRGVRYVDADEGYDDADLYALSRERGFELVCPIARYASTPPERVELVHFYESELGQAVYSWRMQIHRAAHRAHQGRLLDRPSSSQRTGQGRQHRLDLRAAVSAHGLLQSSDRKTAQGTQAHARQLSHPT